MAREWPLLDRLLRHPLLLTTALSVVIVLGSASAVAPNTDWQFFTWGGDLLFGKHYPFVRKGELIYPALPGGLNIYGNYPFLQIGPPALLLGSLLDVGPRRGILLGGAVVQVLGVLAVFAVNRAFPARDRGQRLRALVASCVAILGWGQLTHYRHLDDALALAGMALAALCLRRDRHVGAGILLGFAAATKPWAITVLALVLAPPTWKERLRCGAAAALAVGLIWGPFVLADTRTLDLGTVTLFLSHGSVPWAVGVRELGDPQTLRIVQFCGGLALAVLLVRRGWWPLAPLAAFSFRLLLEPSSYGYYIAAVVAAALLADAALGHAVPKLSLGAAGAWITTSVVGDAGAGRVRLLTYAGIVIVCVLLALRSPPGSLQPEPATRGLPAGADPRAAKVV